MAAYFFDSSALAKRFIRETGTAFVLSLWRPSAHHAIYAARLTEVEVCAALARRHKGLKLAADQFHKSVKRLRRDFTERLAVTATTESIVIEALRLAESYALRGYDALQLASALEANRRRVLPGSFLSTTPPPSRLGKMTTKCEQQRIWNEFDHVIRVDIKPELLKWTRERAGLEIDALALAFPSSRRGGGTPRRT